jgi:transposase
MGLKGHPKWGGRKKGTPNKKPPYMEQLQQALEKYFGDENKDGRTQFLEDLLVLDPKDRVAAAERYLNYIKPKMQSITADVTNREASPIECLVGSLINKQ